MNDNERAMKYFIIFALGSAVMLPICGEIYANISRGFAIAAVSVWALTAGLKFSALPPRTAMLGITAYVFSSGVLSLIGYVIIHPAVKSWLEANSKYFELTLPEWAMYWGCAFGLLAASYVVYFARFGLKKAFGKISDNNRQAASAIDNAFGDDQ